MENAQSLPDFLSMVDSYSPQTGGSTPYGGLTIVSMMAWGLGYFGMPHVLLRFMAIRNEKQLKTSRRIATGWVVISLVAAVFIGIIAVFPGLFGLIAGQSYTGLTLGGTSVMIIVGVALETTQQIESQMMMRHYKGFLE